MKKSATEKKPVRKIGGGTTLKDNLLLSSIAVIFIGVMIASAFSLVFINQYSYKLQENIEGRMAFVARDAAKIIDAGDYRYYFDEFQRVQNDYEKNSAEYLQAKAAVTGEKRFQDIIESLRAFSREKGVDYTYVIYWDRVSEFQFIIFDSDEDDEDNLSLKEYEPPDKFALAAWNLADMNSAVTSKAGIYSVGWEGLMTTYSPLIIDENGQVKALIAVDIPDNEFVSLRTRALSLTIVSLVIVAAMAFLGFSGMVQYRKKALGQAAANLAKSQFWRA